ncbi:CpsD/CapB family tyrosine-protein kinase [Pikeienuella sp. HZG-20]|uniref:CpsD/CapB family tyrosine-protein kinase n=1 Tax=Paludibacillus litoralis TaxID=3133267 RepID=UPI0030EF2EB2
MVERLKQAIDKARAQREGEAAGRAASGPGAAPASPAAAPTEASALWESLREVELSAGQLHRSRIVTYAKTDVAHIPFDLLRTRLLKVFRDNGWRRIAITSPTKGCGKTLVATNLAFSFARQPDLKTLLVDMDLKAPTISRILGLKEVSPIAWFLNGQTPLESAVVRFGDNLALALNGERVRDSTELIQDEMTSKRLDAAVKRLDPDIVIYDLPPMLVSDDAIAFMDQVDCVLMVAAGGQTKAKEIEYCEQMFVDHVNFLGVLLNKGEDDVSGRAYEYA